MRSEIFEAPLRVYEMTEPEGRGLGGGHARAEWLQMVVGPTETDLCYCTEVLSRLLASTVRRGS